MMSSFLSSIHFYPSIVVRFYDYLNLIVSTSFGSLFFFYTIIESSPIKNYFFISRLKFFIKEIVKIYSRKKNMRNQHHRYADDGVFFPIS